MKNVIRIFAFLSVFALNNHAQDFCGTPAITKKESVRALITPQKRSANSVYILKIYFHVIRNSSGLGGVNTSNVSSAYSILNEDFSSHGIYFYWNGTIDYIDNSSYYNNVPSNNIFNVNNHTDGIDIYLYPCNSGDYDGLANGVGMSSELYLYGNYNGTPLCNTHVIAHEMGHVLNLWHTHHGTVTEGDPTNPYFDVLTRGLSPCAQKLSVKI